VNSWRSEALILERIFAILYIALKSLAIRVFVNLQPLFQPVSFCETTGFEWAETKTEGRFPIRGENTQLQISFQPISSSP